MNAGHIDRFFSVLASELDRSATVMITGAAAGSLLGHVRPSQDIDFSIRLVRGHGHDWPTVEAAVARTVKLTSIQANYAEDIDRWGMISLLDYTRHTRPYKRFGKLTVRVLDPAYWAIGKLTRYLRPDIRDLVAVLKAQRVPHEQAVRIWGRALRASPRSAVCELFRRHVEAFLRQNGRKIWGKGFDADAAVNAFHRAAGIVRQAAKV